MRCCKRYWCIDRGRQSAGTAWQNSGVKSLNEILCFANVEQVTFPSSVAGSFVLCYKFNTNGATYGPLNTRLDVREGNPMTCQLVQLLTLVWQCCAQPPRHTQEYRFLYRSTLQHLSLIMRYLCWASTRATQYLRVPPPRRPIAQC